MKRLLLLILGTIYSICTYAQYSLKVGYCEFLELDPPKGIVISASWSHDSGLRLEDSSEVGAIVEVTHYFSGAAYVNVSYSYEYLGTYDNNYHIGRGSKTYRITCIGGTASISEDNIELNVGQTRSLQYSRSDEYGTPTWKSSNEDVVTINKYGTLKAISPGVATITFDPIIAEPCFCDVRVLSVAAQAITLEPEHLEIIAGKTATLRPEYTPTYASATVTWSSENDGVATVSSSGIVTGVSAGETAIVARTENGLTARATVKVIGEPEYIYLPETLEIPIGYQHKLTPSITPVHSYVVYSWESSDTNVIIVDNDGNIKAKNLGRASVTVSTQNNKSATCEIEVREPSEGMDYRNARIRINALKNLFNDIDKY